MYHSWTHPLKCRNMTYIPIVRLQSYVSEQAGRRLVRSLLTICDIGASLHPWPMWITELRITRYLAAYAKFERRTKLVISKLQCNSTDWKQLRSICCLCWTETQSSTSAWTLSYSAVKLFSKNSNLCDHGTWSLRTDRRTTCNLITALCVSIVR